MVRVYTHAKTQQTRRHSRRSSSRTGSGGRGGACHDSGDIEEIRVREPGSQPEEPRFTFPQRHPVVTGVSGSGKSSLALTRFMPGPARSDRFRLMRGGFWVIRSQMWTRSPVAPAISIRRKIRRESAVDGGNGD
jgi:hypothetical protein